MMIGVTSAEAYVLLNNEEMELGLETETRNKLVSDLVTSSFHHHQKEIFSAVITEYTDWAQVARHPITTRQSSHKHSSAGTFPDFYGNQEVYAKLNRIQILEEIIKFLNFPRKLKRYLQILLTENTL